MPEFDLQYNINLCFAPDCQSNIIHNINRSIIHLLYTYMYILRHRIRVCMYIRGFRARQHLRSLAPIMNDYDGQMIFGDLVGLMLPYRWGKTPKKPHPGNLSRPLICVVCMSWHKCFALPRCLPENKVLSKTQWPGKGREELPSFFINTR